MLTEQTATRRRPLTAIVLLLIYIGMPLIAQRADPIIGVSSADHVSYALTHFNTVVENFSNGVMLKSYLLNIMVIMVWLFWIWAVLSALVAVGFQLTHKTITPSTKRWIKVGAFTVFLVWQSFGHTGAVAKNVANASGAVTTTPIVQTMRNTSASTPTTTTTVTRGESLWGIEAQQNPTATPQQIANLVNETATVNGIVNPSVIHDGQVIQVADLGGTATPMPTINVNAPSVPTSAPVINISAPATGAVAPIVVDALHVGGNASTPASSGATSTIAMELLAMGILAGASAFAFKKFRGRQMVKRPKGMVPVAPEPSVFDGLFSLSESEELYVDVRSALAIATALGAPRIDTVLVGKGEIVAHLETTPAPIPDSLAEYVRQEGNTLRFVRPLPTADLDSNGLPYGGLIYLGANTAGEHTFVNIAGRGIVGLPNATDEMWRAIFAQFGWTEWLRTNNTFFYRSRDEFEVPSDLLGEQSVVSGLSDFTSDIANESELRGIVNQSLASANELQRHGTRASLTNARMEADTYGMDVILAKTEISEPALSGLVSQVGRTETLVMLVAQNAPETWTIDADGLLCVPVNGGQMRIHPVTMSVATMLQHVAYMSTASAYVANTLDIRTLASNAQPMIQYFGDELGLHPALSPLANRIALVLGIHRQVGVRELALASLPGLSASEDAFARALAEVQNHLGSAITVANGTVALDAGVGTDLGLLCATTSLREVANLFTGLPMASLRQQWSFAALYGEHLDAMLVDRFVDIAISATYRSPNASLAIYRLLTALFGSTDRIELIKVAVAKASSGVGAAMQEWNKVAAKRQMESPVTTDSSFESQVLDELQELLGASA